MHANEAGHGEWGYVALSMWGTDLVCSALGSEQGVDVHWTDGAQGERSFTLAT